MIKSVLETKAGPALGESVTTFALITGLFFFLSHRRIQNFTPLLFPVLYAVMVYIEAPVSGQAPIRPAAWDLPSYHGIGRTAGFTGWDRFSEPY